MAQYNYVKFMRGTPTAYEALATKDKDTLYFICAKDATRGTLYLGEKIIAGEGSGNDVFSLADIENILISEDVKANSVLAYDEASGKWVNKELKDILTSVAASVMTGATATADGTSGLVPVPTAGMQDYVLLGNGQWSSQLKDLVATVGTLVGDGEVKSIEDIAADIFEGYIGDLEGIKEIIEDPNFLNVNQRIVDINDVLYGTEDKEEDGETIPGTTGLIDTVGSLSDAIQTMQSDIDGMQDDIDAIYERLRWQEMDDDESSTT